MGSKLNFAERARGYWRQILGEIGFNSSFLTQENGPCPFCGGKDRWRFTNFNGYGWWVCNFCGKGDGADLVMKYLNVDFRTAAYRVEQIMQNISGADKFLPQVLSDEEKRRMMRWVWDKGKPVKAGDLVSQYLSNRFLEIPNGRQLKYIEKLSYEGLYFPAMVARVSGPDGGAVNLHRTYLKSDASGKADVEKPRKMMPGKLPPGSAIRLFKHNRYLGVAEGIETAIAAEIITGIPTWSVIDAWRMQDFIPPKDIKELFIFGDNDLNGAGQAAAWNLAKIVSTKVKARVMIPDVEGWDWNDVLRGETSCAAERL